MELRMMARYPFTSSAQLFVREKGPSLEDLVGSISYGEARSLGARRVEEALASQSVLEHGFSTDAECIHEILSYPIARILVSTIGDERLVRWYAHGEAMLLHERLRAEPYRVLREVAGELGLEPREEPGGGHSLHFTQYLGPSSALKGPDWKLNNKPMERGWVKLAPGDLPRLCLESLRMRIESELPLPVPDGLRADFPEELGRVSKALEARKAAIPEEALGAISIVKMPPCMKKLITDSQSGVNIPHVGRFALAAFLHHIGMSSDGIMKVFSVSPDFRPDMARYQIEHITGVSSGTEYTPPECDTMKTNGICHAPDSLCAREWMNHPLTYYRIKDRDEKKRRTKGSGKGDGGKAGDGKARGKAGDGKTGDGRAGDMVGDSKAENGRAGFKEEGYGDRKAS